MYHTKISNEDADIQLRCLAVHHGVRISYLGSLRAAGRLSADIRSMQAPADTVFNTWLTFSLAFQKLSQAQDRHTLASSFVLLQLVLQKDRSSRTSWWRAGGRDDGLIFATSSPRPHSCPSTSSPRLPTWKLRSISRTRIP